MAECKTRVCLAAWLSLFLWSVADAADRPNIVLVLFDDLGYGQPPSYRADSEFKMPRFEQLVTQGMRFSDAHSGAAVCTPTRYGILTGRCPSRIGQFGVCTTYSPPIIPTSRLTVASYLQQLGYSTACIGKWHLGLKWASTQQGGRPGVENKMPVGAEIQRGPNDLGFDYFFGFTHARNIQTIIEQKRVVKNVPAVENQPLMIQKAEAWLRQQSSEKPFFLYFPMCPPHKPIIPSPEFDGKSGVLDQVKKDKKYGDWILQGDAMLGRIMDMLEQTGLADNTLLIATSDNGAERRAYAPLRESKRSIYEGGHRVPFVVRWPAKIKANTTNDAPICLNDFFATVAAIVEKPLPPNAAEDSRSILDLFRGKKQQPHGIIHQSSQGDLAIRQGKWKLVFRIGETRELYDLSNDIAERKNVLSGHPRIAQNLVAQMQDFIDRGRSTPGEPQKNDVNLSLTRPLGKKLKKKRSSANPPQAR